MRLLRALGGMFRRLAPAGRPDVVAAPVPGKPGRPKSAHASIVGTLHLEEGRPGEDRCASFTAPDQTGWAWVVVDGAGSDINARAAAESVERVVVWYISRQISQWQDKTTLAAGLERLYQLAHEAALKVRGSATLVVFVYLPSGLWGVVQVGDAIFVRRDFAGKWHLPIHPFKFRMKRCITVLLGTKEVEHHVLVDDVEIDAFILASDWVCGASQLAPIRDTTPEDFIGRYQPNTAPLNALIATFLPGGEPLTASAAADALVAIREGANPEIEQPRDDESIVAGIIELTGS